MSDLVYIVVTIAFFGWRRPMRAPAIDCEELDHDSRIPLGGVLTLALTAYLVYALLRPERF